MSGRLQERAPGAHAGSSGEYSWLRAATLCLALLLEGMSSSSINVQVVEVQRDLDLGSAGLGLVTAAFLVAYAGLLPVAGRLVDMRGRGPTFLWGTALLGLGCLLCATASSGWLVGVGRSVQGTGAALAAPTSRATAASSDRKAAPRSARAGTETATPCAGLLSFRLRSAVMDHGPGAAHDPPAEIGPPPQERGPLGLG